MHTLKIPFYKSGIFLFYNRGGDLLNLPDVANQ
jgi:hypothetical protein